jgi:hypothetical protein
MWHVLANPKKLPSQALLREILCGTRVHIFSRLFGECSEDQLLESAIGRFKTPTVRNLGHSEPYFHDGSSKDLNDALFFYIQASNLARAGHIRNADPELMKLVLRGFDIAPVADFLRSLNEDYD